MNTRGKHERRSADDRRGTAAVEAALVLPVLVILTLGSIDIAQYINLSQLVTNASREGARLAGRNGITSVTEVENAVRNYLQDSLPQKSAAQISAATTVTLRDHANNPILNGDLTTIETGDAIFLEVAFDYSVVRWLPGPNWNGNSSECRTVCRRE